MGNIKQRVEDAKFNYEHGRYEAALSLLLSAVDGSARKIFPEGVPSINNPVDKKGNPIAMGNKERYVRFLGVRLAHVMGFHFGEEAYFANPRASMVSGVLSPEEKIYMAFRCSDTHESGLPEELKYVFDKGLKDQYELQLSGKEFRFSSGLLKILERVIVEAPTNGKEFGIEHFRLLPKEGLNPSSLYSYYEKEFEISKGRVDILRMMLAVIPDSFNIDDTELVSALNQIFQYYLPEGMKTGLCIGRFRYPPCVRDSGFTPQGIKICRDLLLNFKRVDISS